MPDASVNIGGDASGAVAACAEAKAAIASIQGKTVTVDINVRQDGSAGGIGGLASDLGRAGNAADRAGRSARGMGDNFDRAGRSAHGMGDHLGRAGDHMGRAANEAERMRTHMDAVSNIMGGGAPGAVQHAQGMRQIAGGAQSASRSVGELGRGIQQAQRAIGGGDNGGFRAMGASAHGVSVEVMGIYRNTRQAITAAGEAGQAFSTASGHTSQMGTDLANTGARAGQAGKELARLGESGKELERVGNAARGLGGSGNSLSGMDLAAKGLRDSLGSAVSGFEGVGSTLGGVAGAASSAARPLMMLGLASGVSAIGMGALGAAVAGVGLAGVAEDFAHNNQLMNAGQQAVRGFNKEFSAMRSETSASGMPAMSALGASIKGVGHELAKIGADNMGATLQHASEIAGSATSALHQLAPAVGPAEQALTSLAGAALGAFGNSAPEIARFANVVTQNAGGLQSATEGVIRGASALGGGLVQGLAAAAPVINGIATGTAGAVDAVSGAFGIQSNFAGKPGPDGTPEGAVDTGVPDGHGGTVKTAGSSGLDRFFSGASRGGIAGAGIGAVVGSVVPGIGTGIGMAVGGTVGAVAGGVAGLSGNVANLPGTQQQTTPTYGAPQPQKSMGLSSGGARPPSPDAAQYSGMAPSDILTQQRADVGLPPVGAPRYSGVGPRGPGSAVGVMPASIGSGLGVSSMAPLASLMTGGMQSQVAGGGAATGTAMVQHVQKAVSVAAPAAQTGGAAMGAAMNTGMAQGSNSTQSVIDTVTIKHSKHIIDIASAALGIHSPSTEFDYLARMTWAGFGQGSEKASRGAFGSMGDHMGGVLSAARKTSMDYDGSTGETVTVKKPAKSDDDQQQTRQPQAMQYGPQAMARIQSHNDRAASLAAGREGLQRQAIGGMTHDERAQQLLQNRANNHERALANLGVGGRSKPSGDVNPFAADQANAANRAGGLNAAVNPFHIPGLSGAKSEFAGHGEAITQGVSIGIAKGAPAARNQMSQFSRGMQNQHKKDHGINSPSTVFAQDGMNIAAGVGVGIAAGAPGAIGAVSGMSDAMQTAGQQLSDRGLPVGYSWAQNVITGVNTEIKKADYQSLGLPSGLGQAGILGLAKTGLLSAGSGASGYKTPGNAPGVVTLTPASGGNQTITIVHQIDISGQMHEVATQVTLDMFGKVSDVIPMQASA